MTFSNCQFGWCAFYIQTISHSFDEFATFLIFPLTLCVAQTLRQLPSRDVDCKWFLDLQYKENNVIRGFDWKLQVWLKSHQCIQLKLIITCVLGKWFASFWTISLNYNVCLSCSSYKSVVQQIFLCIVRNGNGKGDHEQGLGHQLN